MTEFETFDFSIEKIKAQAELFSDKESKLTYLAYVRMKLQRVIRCFQSERNVRWRKPSDKCKERDEFYNDRYKSLAKIYGSNDKRTFEALAEDGKLRMKELKDCLLNIKDEIEFISKYEKDIIEIKSNQISTLKKIPSRGVKALAKATCEKLIKDNVITTDLNETKKNKEISSLLIPVIDNEYELTIPNKRTIHDYFRNGSLRIKKQRNGKLIVEDTLKRKSTK
jgi:predicted ATP-binding protein involved in virulence